MLAIIAVLSSLLSVSAFAVDLDECKTYLSKDLDIPNGAITCNSSDYNAKCNFEKGTSPGVDAPAAKDFCKGITSQKTKEAFFSYLETMEAFRCVSFLRNGLPSNLYRKGLFGMQRLSSFLSASDAIDMCQTYSDLIGGAPINLASQWSKFSRCIAKSNLDGIQYKGEELNLTGGNIQEMPADSEEGLKNSIHRCAKNLL